MPVHSATRRLAIALAILIGLSMWWWSASAHPEVRGKVVLREIVRGCRNNPDGTTQREVEIEVTAEPNPGESTEDFGARFRDLVKAAELSLDEVK